MGTAPGHQLVYYEHFFRSRRHGMDSIVDSSLRPGQRRPLRVIQSEPSTSINSQSIGFHSEVYLSTGTSRHRPLRTGELRPQRIDSSSTGPVPPAFRPLDEPLHGLRGFAPAAQQVGREHRWAAGQGTNGDVRAL